VSRGRRTKAGRGGDEGPIDWDGEDDGVEEDNGGQGVGQRQSPEEQTAHGGKPEEDTAGEESEGDVDSVLELGERGLWWWGASNERGVGGGGAPQPARICRGRSV
jgi:hypothetical protein